jgi:hypothetical protein
MVKKTVLRKKHANHDPLTSLPEKKMWPQIEIPVYVLSLWALISTLLTVYNLFSPSILGVAAWVINFAAFGYIGSSSAFAGPKHAAKLGALAGAVAGIVNAILTIFSYYYYPSYFDSQIGQVMNQGIPADAVRMYMTIAIYAGLFITPLILALLGAAISAFFAWIMRNTQTV